MHKKPKLDRLAQCGIYKSVIHVIYVVFKMLKKWKFSRTADLSYSMTPKMFEYRIKTAVKLTSKMGRDRTGSINNLKVPF